MTRKLGSLHTKEEDFAVFPFPAWHFGVDF